MAKRLEFGVTEIEGKAVGWICCRYPLYVTRTSPAIIALLPKCDGQKTVAEIAQTIGKKPAALRPILEALRQKRLLELTETMSASTLGRANYAAVSFVIPVRNRPELLRSCLQSIVNLDYPAEKREIIVVDDASTDATPQVAASFGVKLLQNAVRLGAGPSRNRGAAVARYDLLAFVDSDCVLASDWLSQLEPLFDQPEQIMAGGAIRAVETVSNIGRYEDLRSAAYLGQSASEVKLAGSLNYLPGANLLVRRAAFQAIGGHNPKLRFGQDVDLSWRLLKAGGQVSYHPAAIVRHAYTVSLAGFLKTRFRYATTEAPLQKQHPERRRILEIPLWPTISWLSLMLGLLKLPSSWPLLLAASLPLLWRSGRKWQSLKIYRLPLSRWDVLAAEGRSFLAAGYHLGQHIGRYYSLPLLVLALVKPKKIALPIALALLGPLWQDYHRLKPALHFSVFAALSLLENVAHQIGLIAGCWQARHFRALLPKIEVK